MAASDTTGSPNTPAPFWNVVLRYGGFCALGLIALSLFWYLLDVNVMALGNIVIQFVLLFAVTVSLSAIAIRSQRDELDGGYITFGRALLIGLLVTAIAVFLSSMWNYVLINFIDPSYVDNLKEKFTATWGDNMPADAMDKALEKFDQSGELLTNLKNGVTGGLFIGIISGLISAGIMKRTPSIE